MGGMCHCGVIPIGGDFDLNASKSEGNNLNGCAYCSMPIAAECD